MPTLKGILTALGLLIVLPFYLLYLIFSGLAALMGKKRSPKKKSLNQTKQTRPFTNEELEKYSAIFDEED